MTPRFASLRARLVAGQLLVLAVGVLTVDVIAYLTLRSFLADRLDRQLEVAADVVTDQLAARRSVQLTPTGGLDLVTSPVHLALVADDGRVVALHEAVDGSGTVAPPALEAVLGGPAGSGLAETGPVTVEDVDGGPGYRLVRIPIPDGVTVSFGDDAGPTVTVAEVVVAGSRADAAAVLRRLLVIEVATFVLVMAGGAIAGRLVLRPGLRPLRAMADTATAISAGDATARIPVDDPATEIGAVGVAVNRAFDARRADEERMRRFVADAGHELRTPLAAVRAWSELYLTGAVDDWDGVERAMARIDGESTRMQRLVDDLLTLARLDDEREHGHRDRAVESVDVGLLAVEIVAATRERAPDRVLQCSVGDGDAGNVSVGVSSGERVRQVLDNLVTNAVVHTPASTAVEVIVRGEDGTVTVEVIDDGPGLDRDDAARAFDRFWRGADHTRTDGDAPPGSGLGLSIARDLVEREGGSLGLVTSPGAGVRAIVRLPRPPA